MPAFNLPNGCLLRDVSKGVDCVCEACGEEFSPLPGESECLCQDCVKKEREAEDNLWISTL